jgi:hypothetical protein
MKRVITTVVTLAIVALAGLAFADGSREARRMGNGDTMLGMVRMMEMMGSMGNMIGPTMAPPAPQGRHDR